MRLGPTSHLKQDMAWMLRSRNGDVGCSAGWSSYNCVTAIQFSRGHDACVPIRHTCVPRISLFAEMSQSSYTSTWSLRKILIHHTSFTKTKR
jgi:hypothetical protein